MSYEAPQLQTQVRKNQRTETRRRKSAAPDVGKATQSAYIPKKPVGKMMLFGAMSLAAYCFLFANEGLVTKTYTLGGWHAAFPVLTAFFFSFIHGAFASNLLSVIGLEAKK